MALGHRPLNGCPAGPVPSPQPAPESASTRLRAPPLSTPLTTRGLPQDYVSLPLGRGWGIRSAGPLLQNDDAAFPDARPHDILGAVALLLRLVRTGVFPAFGAGLRRWVGQGTRTALTRDLKRINAHAASVAYPILKRAGELHESRLKGAGLLPVQKGA